MSKKLQRIVPRGVAVLAFAFALSACGGSSKSAAPPTTTGGTHEIPTAPASGAVSISTRTVAGLGPVLVDGRGRTLYMFEPDKQRHVTCVGACAEAWPPLKVKAGGSPVASGKAKASLLGSDRDPAGGRVATYNGWPLYTYVGDASAGTANGQAVDANGGLWYVLAPSGEVIHHRAMSGTG